MKKKIIENYKVIIFILLGTSLLGSFLLRKKRQQISPIAQRGIPYANVSLEISPAEIEICINQEKEIVLNMDPSFKNPNGPANIAAAELSFNFDKRNVVISSVEFHQDYSGSIWNKEDTNHSGKLKLAILSLSPVLPQEKFPLAKVTIMGKKIGVFDLILEKDDYRIMGVRGTTDPNISRVLNLDLPESIKTTIKIVNCNQ